MLTVSMKRKLSDPALMTVISCCLCTQARATDLGRVWVDKPIGKEVRAEIQEEGVRSVFTSKAADEHVFDDPKLFPKLWHASLCLEERNLGNLQGLAANYPKLGSLTIRQSSPLSLKASAFLGKLAHLRALELCCRVENPALLQDSLSPEIEQLEIVNSNLAEQDKLTITLPRLRELTIENGKLSPSFLKNLDAPKLDRLCLFGVNLESAGLMELKRFSHLRQLNLAGSTLNNVDYADLRSLGRITIIDPANRLYSE